jgi:type IV pilus assembly protein PilA
VAIILIIAAIAIPNLLRAKMSANDSAAASTIRTLNTAEVSYVTAYPTVGYANTLTILGPGTACNSSTACLIDNVLSGAATPTKSGYTYGLTSTSTAAPFGDYTVSATPITWGSTGGMSACSTTDAVVRSTKSLATQPTASATLPETAVNCVDPTKYLPIQ